MKKTTSEVLKKIKEKQKAEKKSNYTFRLPDTLMDGLRAKCEKHGVSMTSVIEETIEDFIRGN